MAPAPYKPGPSVVRVRPCRMRARASGRETVWLAALLTRDALVGSSPRRPRRRWPSVNSTKLFLGALVALATVTLGLPSSSAETVFSDDFSSTTLGPAWVVGSYCDACGSGSGNFWGELRFGSSVTLSGGKALIAGGYGGSHAYLGLAGVEVAGARVRFDASPATGFEGYLRVSADSRLIDSLPDEILFALRSSGTYSVTFSEDRRTVDLAKDGVLLQRQTLVGARWIYWTTNYHVLALDNVVVESARPLQLPTGLLMARTGPGAHEIRLDWGAPPGPLMGYRIYAGDTPGGTRPVAAVAPDRTSFIDGGLANGALRFYQVSAISASYESPLTAEVSARAAREPGTPQAVRAGSRMGSFVDDFSSGSLGPAWGVAWRPPRRRWRDPRQVRGVRLGVVRPRHPRQ